ncbi:MAG: endonuclease MutS2 [Acutalibacteraceae bacterium]
MNKEKYYKMLELDKILSLLADETSSEEARQNALAIRPLSGMFEVQQLLSETNDAHMLIGRFGNPSFGGIKNVSSYLRRAEAGGGLSMIELIRIAQVLRVIRAVREWYKHSANIETTLDMYFDGLVPNKYLEEKINTCIVSEEEMSDNASAELATLRRKIRMQESRAREQLEKLVRSTTYQKYLQDAIITMRGGRYVVPVKAEFRANIPGLVHDTSSSGATVFVEPMKVVDINNEIKVLKSKEQEEIERILYELSAEAGSFADGIISSYKYLIELDVIFAKARLAYKMNASMPLINDEGQILLRKARHPLISKDKVVATDIELGISFDTLVITGPNTGGKTVSLKTLALLTLMAMCGMMIPAADNSKISVFDNILADIGDEQSIEQSLSTFSAHMTNIIDILSNTDSHSLVIVDELGAGTDPVEGAALAIAILESLREKGAKIAATTHYAELKAYALQTYGVENGCCEFDVATLRPTYRLLIGLPGRSNAFAISQRLGMDIKIVDRAKELVSSENRQFEDIITDLQAKQQSLEQRLIQADEMNLQSKKAKENAERELERIKRISEQELEKAKADAQNLVARTKAQAYAMLDELEQIRKNKNNATAEDKSKLKADIKAMENSADPVREASNDSYTLPRKLKQGDSVLIFDIDKKAVVLEPEDSSGNVLVQAGIIKTRVSVKNLRLLNEKTAKSVAPTSTRSMANRTGGRAITEVDVRGMTASEAVMAVDNAIDGAVLMNINQLTIIHGKGTGVLRREIQAHLKGHKAIRTFRLGVYGEGESGVTIAELK